MRDLKNKLTSSKNTKNIQDRKGKSFGYQVLGFGAGGSVSPNPFTADYFMLGGGGGGKGGIGGGGGAGGFIFSYSNPNASGLAFDNGTYNITIGSGGTGGAAGKAINLNGNTVTFTATGTRNGATS